MLVKLFWILAFFGGVFGGLLIAAAFNEDSAPKQAASAAIGCGLAIVPYVIARAVAELSPKK